MYKCLVLCCLVSLALGHTTNTIDDAPRASASYLGDFKFLYKTYADCASADASTCLKLKLFTILDRVSRSLKDFKVTEGVKFTRDPEVPVDETPVQTEKDIEAELPRSLDDKDKQLNSLIFDKVLSFFQSHTLQVRTN